MNSIFNFIPQEVASSFGWTFLHSLWQGGVISILLYIALYLLRNKSAGLRALLSASALILLVVTAVITCININVSGNKQNSIITDTFTNISHANLVNTQSGPDLQGSGINLNSLLAQTQKFINENVEFIFWLWVIGLLFFALRYLGGAIYLSRIRKYSFPVEDKYWHNIINRIGNNINLKKRIGLAESGYLKVPVAMGYLKPMILFPLGIISGLPQEQIEAIIAHEMAHIKRYDLFVNLFQSAAEIVFFFNPFVWWISKRIRIEREFCCDDIAINQCGDELIYAKALANLDSLIESNMPLFAVPLFKNHNQLLRRIDRMLQQDQNQNNLKEKFTAVIIFIVLLASAVIFKNTNAQQITHAVMPADIISYGSISAPGTLSAAGFDTTKSHKGTQRFNFQHEENGVKKDFRVTIIDGKLTALFIDDEKVAKEDFGKYSTLINKIVKEHEAEMIQHDKEMKQHQIEMKQHEKEMQKHEIEMVKQKKELESQMILREKEMKQNQFEMQKNMKSHETDLKKQKLEMESQMKISEKEMKEHQIQMQQHEKALQKYNQEMQQHKKDMVQHNEEMVQHDKEMIKYEEEMKLHKAEMKIFDAFIKDIKQMLSDAGIKNIKDSFSLILDSGRIVVNGQKLSKELLDKALKLYKNNYNEDIGEQTFLKNAKI